MSNPVKNIALIQSGLPMPRHWRAWGAGMALLLTALLACVAFAVAGDTRIRAEISFTPFGKAQTRVSIKITDSPALLAREAWVVGGAGVEKVGMTGKATSDAYWLNGAGTAEVASERSPTMVIGFACLSTGQGWQCGCDKSDCDAPRWQVWGPQLKSAAPAEKDIESRPAEDQMLLSGTYRFRSPIGEAVAWSVDRFTIPADSFDPPVEQKNIFAAYGTEATIPLRAEPMHETNYTITIKNGSQKESFVVRVFPPGDTAAFTYESAGNLSVLYLVATPPQIDEQTRLIQVFHDSARNVHHAISHWTEWAKANNTIIIAPSFPYWDWPVDDYGEGNVFNEPDGKGQLNPRWNWTFTIADDAARRVIDEFGLTQATYDIFGHSGGGRFTHRFMLFMPQAPIRYAFPANPGRWTLPSFATEFPWGLSHPLLSFTEADLRNFTNRKMIIVRGLEDIYRDLGLDITPQGDAQGPHRLARAQLAYDMAKAFNPDFNWELLDVPDCGHNESCLVPEVQAYLEAHDERKR